MILVEFLALFLCGSFFGAAAYISIAQHPATINGRCWPLPEANIETG